MRGAALVLLLAVSAFADDGFTLNAEVLQRYGYTLDAYNALDLPARERLEDWIRAQEEARKRLPPPPAPPVRPKVLDREEKKTPALDSLKAMASESPIVPHLELQGGEVRRLSLGAFEVGQVGLGGRSPLVAPSPYFGVESHGEGSGARLDYSWRARANVVGLGARLYGDDQPALDRRIDSGLDSLKTLDPAWGIDPGEVDGWKKSLSFSTSYETSWLFLGSAMGRIGRAYHLLPRVDVGWSAMGVGRVAGIFPNAALDQTAGARVNVADGQNVGVFGGVTETPRLFGAGAIRDSLSGDKFKLKTDPGVDAAPHASVAAWGRLPYLSNARYEVSAGQQWNPWTTVRTVSAGASVDSVGAFARHEDESGPDMEFSRKKSSAGVSVSPSRGVDVTGSVFAEAARYGSASMESKGVWLGLTVRETEGPAAGASVTMNSLFGGRPSFVSEERQSYFVRSLQTLLDVTKALKNAGLGEVGGAGGGWAKLHDMWGGLDPGVRKLLEDAWAQYNPGAPSLENIMAIKPGDLDTANRFVDLIADTRVVERLVVRYLRSRLLEDLEKVEIPVLGKNVRLSAPVVIAAAHAYGLSVGTLPPITERDARESLDAFLLRKLAGKLDCGQQDATDCVLGKLPEDARKRLEKDLGDSAPELLKAAVAWPSDVIRREMNRLVLQVILAAETLNELSVDKGERIADHNVRALMSSFAYLDQRSRAETNGLLQRAASHVREELSVQDAALKRELAEYGAARLAWLQSQPAWPKGVKVAVRDADWAPLLSYYGDAKLFDLILKAKAEHGGNILITCGQNAFGTTIIKGDPTEIRLGPSPAAF